MPRFHFKITVYFLSIFLCFASMALGQGLALDEKAELKKWGNKMRNNAGTLLTPPRGRIHPDIQYTKTYVEGIVEDLAGEELRRRGINLVVNIYSSNAVNAFAYENSMNPILEYDDFETAWKEEHESVWPIRRFLGFDNNGKPIIELGFFIGLFRKVKFKDELAFIISHELSHVFEEHTKPEMDFHDVIASWWNMQRYETVADHEGLKRMIGKYELDAALLFLNRVLAIEGADRSMHESYDYMKAGAEAHHHEGVRIAMLQAAVEYFRHTDPLAEPKALIPLPSVSGGNWQSRTQKKSEKFEIFKGTIFEIVRDVFLTPSEELCLYDWSDQNRYFDQKDVTEENGAGATKKKITFPSESIEAGFRKYHLAHDRPTPQQLSEAFFEAFQRVEASSASKQIKGDAFLKLVSFFNYYYRRTSLNMGGKVSHWNQLGPQALTEIRHFLFQISGGESPWDLEASFLSHGALTFHLIENPNIQKIIVMLLETEGPVSQKWRKWLSKIPQAVLAEEKYSFRSYLLKLLDEEPGRSGAGDPYNGPLLDLLREDALAFLKTQPLTDWAQIMEQRHLKIEGQMEPFYPKFYISLKAAMDRIPVKGEEKTFQFAHRLAALFQEANAVFVDMRDRLIETHLLQGDFRSENIELVTETLLSSRETFPLSEALRKKLREPLLKALRRLNHEETLEWTLNRWHFLNVFFQTLPIDQLSSEDQKELFLFVRATVTYTRPAHDLSLYGNALVDEMLEGLTAKDILERTQMPYPALKDRIQAVLPKVSDPENHKELSYKIGYWGATDANFRLSVLHMVGKRPELMARVAREFDATSFSELLDQIYRVYAQASALDYPSQYNQAKLREEKPPSFQHRSLTYVKQGSGTDQPYLSVEASRFLIEAFIHIQDEISDFQDWHHTLRRIMALATPSFQPRYEAKDAIEASLVKRLRALGSVKAFQWLRKKSVLSLIRANQASPFLVDYLEHILQEPQKTSVIAEHVQRIEATLKIKERFPDLFKVFREDVAERLQLQPHQLETIFPEDPRTLTQQTEGHAGEIRGLSAFVGGARKESKENQLHLIEYLMGRREDQPAFVGKIAGPYEGDLQLANLVRTIRNRLDRETVEVRVLVANSFLAGPTSFIETEEGMNFLISNLLKSVSPEKKEGARMIAHALVEAQGVSPSLALAYVLGQKQAPNAQQLSEGEILRSLFLAFGVPGQKLAQYLAYTGEMQEYGDLFSSFQDAASPITYLAALHLVQERFEGQWPMGLRMIGIKGSGTVNIAIEYFNPVTQKEEILNISRQNIQTATQEQFRKFDLFLEALTKTKRGKELFGFLLGLSPIIKRSVELEFQKEEAFQKQQFAKALYEEVRNGWAIQTVDVYSIQNMSIFMQMASGKTARKILEESPEVYREAMRAFGELEYELLLGVQSKAGLANPDLHDGQILIDRTKKLITIIDFGQAVLINDIQRNTAVEILRVVSGVESKRTSASILNRNVNVSQPITPNDLEPILALPDRMDRFIRLISFLERRGAVLDIAVVHWILGLNRLMVLEDKTGLSVQARVKYLLFARKMGIPLSVYRKIQKMYPAMRHLSVCEDLLS